MFAWPQCPPQSLRIPNRSSDDDQLQLDDSRIVKTISLVQYNLVILLTPARVLVYNMKPFALVSSHERSVSSIQEFGENVTVKPSIQFEKPIKGLFSERERDSLVWFQGKIVFYVQTSNNYLLTYQILKNSTPFNIFTDYGVTGINPNKFKGKLEQDYDYNLDDEDTLIVFEKGKSSKVIQDGYPASKDKSIIKQILNTNPENITELPIKKVELRLKIVLKFDSDIIDILGFKKYTNVGDGTVEEHLLILFPHGLQLLSLVDFKLRKSSLIKMEHGKCITVCDGRVTVTGEYPDTQIPIINSIDMKDLEVKSVAITQQKNLITCLDIDGSLVLIFENKMIHFNLEINQIEYECTLLNPIKLCKKMGNDLILILTQTNILQIFTKYGNLLFSTEYDEDDSRSFPIFKYTDIIHFDLSLLTTTETGEYQLWPLYELNNGSFTNFRVCKTHILNNNCNEIILYSPSNDRPSNIDLFPTIKLHTDTINNYISSICVNENQKLLAVHIANKDLLLVQNMETNTWTRYEDLLIIDMQWLGTSYLVCHVRADDDSNKVICARIPMQEVTPKLFSDHIIWQYEIPETTQVFNVITNTISKYRLLKMRHKGESKVINNSELIYKTGEIIVVTNTGFIVFDIISNIEVAGLNIVKNIYEVGKIHMVDLEFLREVRWLTNYKDGYFIQCKDKMFKMERKEQDKSWKTENVLNGIERIIDVIKEEIYLVQKKDMVAYRFEELWDSQEPMLRIHVEEELYPMSVTPDSASFRSLKCIFNKELAKMVVKYEIYLDKLIVTKLQTSNADLDSITRNYYGLKHYKFALEKILSLKVINQEDLTDIITLVKLCHDPSVPSIDSQNVDMLEIVSNCLRKIEVKYWKQLFISLDMTPRDLLALCIECNETRVLGILLLVFLNYNDEGEDNEGQLMQDLAQDADITQTQMDSIPNILKDQEMMLHILKILVTGAASTRDRKKASDNWDMCFQLIRILKALDKENNTDLVNRAMEML
ncbi:similar to Saccharomyces cerevisiae YLR039C RIC1 Protein involved in retrograde transport to the cis-Golgi network [Maudiozyma barnettii]|uniref:Similar to Saccharomyces cerevisiae YLR039C RIC1 Protein involved in retrograde transport to the cis-Golgi network n=1 Tax=Maudiozyma barnettii TaxID=61262 RepID=A0A8H2ZKL9_9SACH|nr:Ric1p [Kazachstania barnettii]CAB4257103.1 similar to Saccharomyces cerevisiae YLR039C RIC1 Protein involved in retrograde transport to the cis-Golgi network [Kazachstania barnettii]CAD1779473.1 similar to Saccharomyces cerevisiae YLR039C RIC1 Protein involved in retrograde transport to the cis-Golgi network [Kazachstania barnettii]